MVRVKSFDGLLDPRLRRSCRGSGPLDLSLPTLSTLRERVSKPAKLRIRGASPLRTQRVCVLCVRAWFIS